MSAASNPPNPFDTYHLSPVSYDEKGRPYAVAAFTPRSDTKRIAVIAPPNKVIPVVFVPGIMGSNLKFKDGYLPPSLATKRFTKVNPDVGMEGWGDLAWRPDNAGSFMVQRYSRTEPHERRALLDPTKTEVDPRAPIPDKCLEAFRFASPADGKDASLAQGRRDSFSKEMTRRGWGTVSLESYGPLLAFLEKNLNLMYWRGDLNAFWKMNILERQKNVGRNRYEASDWGIVKGDKPLTEADVKKAARYWLPVHAAGYNWLQSNRQSGIHVANEVKRFIKHYQDLGYECDKALLVTHSMGGLVARAAVHADMGKLADAVIGVMHGVMPTHGAAPAYRRCRAGFETGWDASIATSRVLGKAGSLVTAIFSNSPGALELLPNKLYGTDWLKVKDKNGTELLSLPKADPYKEIYEQKDAWWRLMNPDWVEPTPGASDSDKEAAWDKYLNNLSFANKFHDRLSSTCHPHTHIQYGNDADDNRAFGSVIWQAEFGSKGFTQEPIQWKDFSDGNDGTVVLRNMMAISSMGQQAAKFKVSDNKDDAGDGTVPFRSAKMVDDKAELVARHSGYEHQGSYQDSRAQELIAYGVVRLIAENMP